MISTVIARLTKVNTFDKMLSKFECFNKGDGEIPKGMVEFLVAWGNIWACSGCGLMQWHIQMWRLGHGMEFCTFLLDLTSG
jgi:hypothetical protein